jgi:translation initiation factor 2B subunit (eIF-2B alpha/beta/delta family)
MELTMADEKSHTQQGQIERAQRLRRVIEDLKEGHTEDQPSSKGKSLKEQIDERADALVQNQKTSDS